MRVIPSSKSTVTVFCKNSVLYLRMTFINYKKKRGVEQFSLGKKSPNQLINRHKNGNFRMKFLCKIRLSINIVNRNTQLINR